MKSVVADILLSVTLLREEEKFILEALEKEGLKVSVLRKEELGDCLDSGINSTLALVRNLSHRDALGVARLLEYSGTKTLNTSRAIEFCSNKAYQGMAFYNHAVPHPEFRIAFSVEDVATAGSTFGWPYIVKPVDASWGRGVVRIVDDNCFESWAGGRESCDVGEKSFPVIVQREINKGDFDIRVVVIGYDPVVAFKRVSSHWKTNTHLGASVEPILLSAAIREVCHKLVNVVGPGFYGIDLFEDQESGNIMVCEINHNPEFSRSMKIHGVKIPELLARYIKSSLELGDSRHDVVMDHAAVFV